MYFQAGRKDRPIHITRVYKGLRSLSAAVARNIAKHNTAITFVR